MKFTRAEITARSEAKKRELGFIQKRPWIPNTPEAIAEFESYIEKLKQKFNMMKIGE